MNEKQREILDNNLQAWINDLGLDGVIPYLRQEKVLLDYHVEDIKVRGCVAVTQSVKDRPLYPFSLSTM